MKVQNLSLIAAGAALFMSGMGLSGALPLAKICQKRGKML